MSNIFISHSSRDGRQATELLTWLHTNGFTETFLDFDKHAGLAPGSDWERTLYREMASSEAVILILTKNWFESKWCFAEFTQARALGKAIFPLIEAPSGETFVSPDIQHLDLLKDREGGLTRLAKDLSEVILNARGGFQWDVNRPPYPGLLAFDESDAAIYFGRDDDIRRLIERLNARRTQGGAKLITVLGASGSGKSSLLRAGALPRLKREKRNWIALPAFRPQLHPMEELAQSIAICLGSGADWRHWRDAFAAKDLSSVLSGLARDLRAAHSANEAQILITIDQAEELFGVADKAETEEFFGVIKSLTDEKLPFLVVLALRSDYLDQLQRTPALNPSDDFSLIPMPLARVRNVIEGPAHVGGLTVDDGLVSSAMADAKTDDALPLLAFALRELYDRFGKSRRLTVETYLALGDNAAQLSPLENAVRRKADEVIDALKPSVEDLQALKEAFVPAMVRVNAEGEYVRRPASLDGLPEKARPLIERLANARLLIIRKDQDSTMVEVAHEALLRKWPLLRGWLDEEREFLIGKDQLEQDLCDWEKAPAGQKTDALLAGLKLTRARIWLETKPNQLGDAEHKFIRASTLHRDAELAERERSRHRTMRISTAAAVIFAIVATGAAWEWRSAKSQQAFAESRELASEARQVLLDGGDLGLALRRAVDAIERRPTEEAELALRTALEGPLEELILHHDDVVASVAFSFDGKRIVTTTMQNVARVWDPKTGKLVVTLPGYIASFSTASVSPRSPRIVTTSSDNSVKVWDTETNRVIATLTGHTATVTRAAFSANGARIVTASSDQTARVWDADTGHLVAVLTGHSGPVSGAMFSCDGKRVLTAGTDKTARVWDAETGRPLFSFAGHQDGVFRAKFSPNGERVVTYMIADSIVDAPFFAQVWDGETGHLVTTLNGHTWPIFDAEFSPDSRQIVTASADRSAMVWDAESGHALHTLIGHAGGVLGASFSADGKRILTGSVDHTARIWDGSTGDSLAILSGHSGWVGTPVFSSDGKQVITESEDHTARVWDVESGHPVATLSGHDGVIRGVEFAFNGKRALTADEDRTAREWDAETGRLMFTFSVGEAGWMAHASFSPDGRSIVTSGGEPTPHVWNAETGQLLVTLVGHADVVNDALFSPDGNRIVTASNDRTARVWDAKSGRLLQTLTGSTVPIMFASFSPDGKRIVTTSDENTASLWETETGRQLVKLAGHTNYLLSATFSPNGKQIVTASQDHTARIWDVETGHVAAVFTGHGAGLKSAKFSPDGEEVVTTSEDHTARVWNVATGRLVTTLPGNAKEVWDASFSPDGKRIITASGDHSVQIWNAKTGNLLGSLAGQRGSVLRTVFSPDGKRIAAAGEDFTARIYIAELEELLKWAKAHLPIESSN